MKKLVRAYQRVTIYEAVNEVGNPCGSAKAILTEELRSRQTDSALRLRQKPLGFGSAAVLGGKTNRGHTAATVLTRPRTV